MTKRKGGVGPGQNSLAKAQYDVKFREGDRSMLIEPLDWAILEMMPDFDTNVGGLYQLGSTATDIRSKLGVPVTVSQLSTRIRVLHVIGLCRAVRTLGATTARSGKAWQKTTFGEEELKKWEAQRS